MIRFIDLRNAEIEEIRFAFFNTVYNQFAAVNNIQAWATWQQFEEDCDDAALHGINGIERCKQVCPEWVFEDENDTGE